MDELRLAAAQEYVVDASLHEDSNLSDLQNEYENVKAQRKRKLTLLVMNKSLVTLVAGLETAAVWLRQRTRLELRLEGLSDSVSQDIADFEPALVDLYNEHSDKIHISPLMGLVILLINAAKNQHSRNLEKDRHFEQEKIKWERDFAMERLRRQHASPPENAPVKDAHETALPKVSLEPSSLLRERLNPETVVRPPLSAIHVPAPPVITTNSLTQSPMLRHTPSSTQTSSPMMSPSVHKTKDGGVSRGLDLTQI